MRDDPAQLRRRPYWRGLPVPYINCVGDEADDRLWPEPRYDALVGQDAWFTASPARATDRPDFTKQCLQREREIVVMGLCQVCGRKLSELYRLAIEWDLTNEQVVTGKAYPMLGEPWMCGACIPYVLNACPAVRRRVADGTAIVVRMTRWSIVLSTGWNEMHGPDVSAVMWAKIVPTDYEVFSVEDYLNRRTLTKEATSG